MSSERFPWHTEPKVDHQAAGRRALSAARARNTDPNSAPIKAYALKAFDAEITKVRNAAPGERNHQLFKSAANLFELVAAHTLSEADVAGALREACQYNGLISDDGSHAVEATLASGRRKGIDSPRDLSHVGTGTNGFVIDDAPVQTVSLSTVFDMERGFWDSRASLRAIYLGALARMCAPWAVLGFCAARALAQVRPHCTLPPLIGGPGTLNWFCAITATSGGGKSSAEAVARELVDAPVLQRNLGSGEGVIDAYIKPADKETGEPKGRHESVMFVADEIDTLSALGNRSGNTLMPVLKTGFSGGTIGFSYRQSSDVHLEAHTYRMTLVANIQPAKAGPLMDDETGGTLQRFMWFPGHDPRITIETPDMPAPLAITPASKWLYPIHHLKIPYEAIELIRDERARQMRGETDPLDGHSMYIREKFAFALAVLDGRAEMSYDDWFLAGIASKVSNHTRRFVRAELDKASESESMKRGVQQGITRLAADDEHQHRSAQRLNRLAQKVLRKLNDDGRVKERELKQLLGPEARYLPVVLEKLTNDCLARSVESTNKRGPKGLEWELIEDG